MLVGNFSSCTETHLGHNQNEFRGKFSAKPDGEEGKKICMDILESVMKQLQ